MQILSLQLATQNLSAQRAFYAERLGLPVTTLDGGVEVQVGATRLIFTQAEADFEGSYHFAFNIPENQFHASQKWLAQRTSILADHNGKAEFASEEWNSHSLYFKDPAGNILEFVARHNLKNAAAGEFTSAQILNVSEIGLPATDVIPWAYELCTTLGLTVFMQEPAETFTPVGDDQGLFILPVTNRIWMPDSGVPAKLLPVTVTVLVNGNSWQVQGVPYVIRALT